MAKKKIKFLLHVITSINLKIALNNRSRPEIYILHDSIYTKLRKKKNPN